MKTIAFIDAAQVRPSVVSSRLRSGQLDWVGFKDWLASIANEVSGREDGLFDVHYFDCIPENTTADREKFHNFLRFTMNFQLHFTELSEKRRTCPECHYEQFDREQKGVDVGMAVSMMKLAYNGAYDQAILCSGDGDFAGLIQFLREALGKRIIAVGWDNGIAPNLIDNAYTIYKINDHADKFDRRPRAVSK